MNRFAAGLLVLATLLPSAQAAGDKLRIGIFGSGKGAGPLLTRTELRECLALEARVVEGTPVAAREREELEAQKAELTRRSEAIQAERATLDRTKVEDVEAYVARAKANDQAIDEFDARSNAFNTRVATLEADRASFKQRCDNRRFDLVDQEALRRQK